MRVFGFWEWVFDSDSSPPNSSDYVDTQTTGTLPVTNNNEVDAVHPFCPQDYYFVCDGELGLTCRCVHFDELS